VSRVLGRLRLSRVTDESTSLERQQEYIEERCRADGHTIVGWAVDPDFSRSISPFDAPEFGPWLKDPEKIDSWDIVIGWRLDRFGAGLINLGPLFNWILENGKALVCTHQQIDLTTPMGRIFATIIAEMAQSELEGIQERTSGSRKKLRDAGRWAGGKPPYFLMPVKTSAGWTLRPDPVSSPITLDLIEGYLTGRSVNAMCEELTKKGVPNPTDHRRNRDIQSAEQSGIEYTGPQPTGGPWHGASVFRILENELLRGRSVHSGKTVRDDNNQPVIAAQALVDDGLWVQIQAETARRKSEQSPRREQSSAPLLGVVKCGRCGGPLYQHKQIKEKNGKRYEYRNYMYYCKHMKMVNAALLEKQAPWALALVIGTVKRLERVYVRAVDHTAELEEAEQAAEDLFDELQQASSDRMKERIQARIKLLDDRMAELERMPQNPAHYDYVETGETFAEAFDRMSLTEFRDTVVGLGITLWVTWDRPQLNIAVNVPEDLARRLGLEDDSQIGEFGQAIARLQALPPDVLAEAVAAANAESSSPGARL
jgi:DNA invertase Pin-like site-specific DNA recombinase